MVRRRGYDARNKLALRAPVSPRLLAVSPRKGRLVTESRLRVAGAPRCALRCPLSRVLVLLGGRRVTGSAITTQLAPRLPAAVGSAASEVMMLGSGEFVMLLLRCCLLPMRWLLMLLLLLRPRGRTGARPMRAQCEGVLPGFGGELDRFVPAKCVLLGCTECAVRALSEKVRGGCVHSP